METQNHGTMFADHVALTVPTHAASKLVRELDPKLAAMLSEVSYVSTATVFLAYRKYDVRHPLDGVGFLVPKAENRPILACTFVSSKWDHRAPSGQVLLRVFVRGAGAQHYLAELYRKALAQFGHEPQPIAVHSPGIIADGDQEALDTLWPHYEKIMNRIGRERGWGAVTREHFEGEAGPHGALYAGSPETVAQKIAAAMRTLGAQRFDLKYSNGTLPHEVMMRSIELYATQVVPRVRELLAETDAAAEGAPAAASPTS